MRQALAQDTRGNLVITQLDLWPSYIPYLPYKKAHQMWRQPLETPGERSVVDGRMLPHATAQLVQGPCFAGTERHGQLLQGCSTDAGHDAGVDARGVTGGSAGPELDVTTPPFVPADAEDSEALQRNNRGGAISQEDKEASTSCCVGSSG